MADAVSILIGTKWVLERLDDLVASVGPAPTGVEVMTFHGDSVSDNHQNAAPVHIAPDVIQFGPWANGGVGVYSESPSPPSLSVDQQLFLFSLLAGETTWAATDHELVISKPEVGSAKFAAASA